MNVYSKDIYSKQDSDTILGIIVAVMVTIGAIIFTINGVYTEDSSITEFNVEEQIKKFNKFENESIKISIDANLISLDQDNVSINGNVVYHGYKPELGTISLDVFSITTGESFYSTELTLQQNKNGVWESDFAYPILDSESITEKQVFRISSENGSLVEHEGFEINFSDHTSYITVGFTDEIGLAGTIVPSLSDLNINKIESGMAESVVKRFHAEVLNEYYTDNISESDARYFIEYENIDCVLTSKGSDDLKFFKFDCALKPR